jgi:hypothetical protein
MDEVSVRKFVNALRIGVLFSFMSVHYRTLKSTSGQQGVTLAMALMDIHLILNVLDGNTYG